MSRFLNPRNALNPRSLLSPTGPVNLKRKADLGSGMGPMDKNDEIAGSEGFGDKQLREATIVAENRRKDEEFRRQAALIARNAERARTTRRGQYVLGGAGVTNERKTLLGA